MWQPLWSSSLLCSQQGRHITLSIQIQSIEALQEKSCTTQLGCAFGERGLFQMPHPSGSDLKTSSFSALFSNSNLLFSYHVLFRIVYIFSKHYSPLNTSASHIWCILYVLMTDTVRTNCCINRINFRTCIRNMNRSPNQEQRVENQKPVGKVYTNRKRNETAHFHVFFSLLAVYLPYLLKSQRLRLEVCKRSFNPIQAGNMPFSHKSWSADLLKV